MNDRDRTPTGDLDSALPGSPLTPLRELHGYRVVAGDPDVRGWGVLGADGRRIGEVEDLLVDTAALRVRYLEVELDLPAEMEAAGAPSAAEIIAAPGRISPMIASAAMSGQPLANEALLQTALAEEEAQLDQEQDRGSGSRHILIPIGLARLDPQQDRVLVEGLRAGDAAGLPDYDGGHLDREGEATLRRCFDRAHIDVPESDFYAHDLYDEDRFYGPRRLDRLDRIDRSQAIAETARAAGLEPGAATPAGEQDRTITGELDRAVHAPDHSVLRGREETAEVAREEEGVAASARERS